MFNKKLKPRRSGFFYSKTQNLSNSYTVLKTKKLSFENWSVDSQIFTFSLFFVLNVKHYI